MNGSDELLSFPKEKGFSIFFCLMSATFSAKSDGHGQILRQDRKRQVGLNSALIEKWPTGLKYRAKNRTRPEETKIGWRLPRQAMAAAS